MTHRYLMTTTFATLSIADKIRAYLLIRTTPVSWRTLARLSGSKNVTAALDKDRVRGWVRPCAHGHYRLTRAGRRVVTTRLPASTLGVGVSPA